ncbi:uncharacterized protein LOC117341497 [Pecten maximus]|uniref:uncharacterized protein LOC117341497 n=1 Tax=Pecten maximus TaxID=6579 RepID=UPI0014583FC1|nr:uncharacterized protein LOC117341497 [Pecten maximus]
MELKWREDNLRADLAFPDTVFIRNLSSAVMCLALCSRTDDCDGVSFAASTLTCRGHSLVDVTDMKKGVASPGSRFWINRNCQRNDYMYIRSLDWCIKLVWTLWPKSRKDVKKDCKAENARLVNVDSREKHNVLVRKLRHILLLPLTTWWISGRKDGGVWKWDDGTPISTDSDLWNTFPPVPFLSTCLCYFEQLIPPGKRFWPCVCIGSNGVICEEFP